MPRIRTAAYKEQQRLRFHEDPSRRQSVVERVDKLRRTRIQYFTELLGGKCIVCNYNRCVRALDFHHVIPGTKRFQMNMTNMTRPMKDLLEEIKKCVLLCSNCHRELHAGDSSIATIVSDRFRRDREVA